MSSAARGGSRPESDVTAERFLAKPHAPSELLANVRTLLDEFRENNDLDDVSE